MRVISLWILICTLTVGGWGCEEEGIPPTDPSILSASLLCSQQGNQYYLESFSMTVEDVNGSATLLVPSVEVLSIALPLTSKEILSAKAQASQDAQMMMDESEDTGDEETEGEETEGEETEGEEMDASAMVEVDSCTFESCKVRYSWSAQTDSESSPILCGDDGEALVAYVRIMDESGREQSAEVYSTQIN